jgi:hypothetical protein
MEKTELLEAVRRGERKEFHPDSIGFALQLEGLTDAQIESNMWLSHGYVVRRDGHVEFSVRKGE